ncbi:MAG: MFS transporter [Clostridia bacterium]|nr:MFS transporter [Clostridia bacterium]
MPSSTPIRGKAKAIAWLCTLVYFGSYMTRQNFNVMLLYVIGDFSAASGMSSEALSVKLSVILTAMTVTYGAGQVICGFIGDKIKPQYMLTGGLGLAALTNILMALPLVSTSENIVLMTVLWAVNGFAHSMLWPPIVRIMSMYLTDDEYGYSAVRVSWGSQFATIILYLGCPLLVTYAHLSWRTVIFICAVAGIVIDVVWNIFYPKLLREPLKEAPKKANGKKGSGAPLPALVIIPLICIFFGIIFQGIMRDGVTNWTPKLLDDTFDLGEALSTVSAVVLAVFSIISFSLYDKLHRKVFKNEVFCAGMIFAFTAIIASVVLAMFVFDISSAIVSIILMGVIVANMHGINLMLITVVPKRFIKSGKVSLFSGILNACTYIGAAVGNTAFAWLSTISAGNGTAEETVNWTPVVISWVAVSVLGLAVCLAAAPLWKKFCKTYAED